MSRFLALLSVFLFVLSLVTTLRFRWFSKLWGGLANQFRIHHWLGVLAVVTIALHVIWEVFQIQSGMILETLVFSGDLGLISAWIALGLLFVSLIASYQRWLSFRVWRSLHLLFLLSFGFAAIHGVLFLNDHWFDKVVIFGSLLLSVGTLMALFLCYFFMPRSHVFKVLSQKEVQASIWEIVLEPLDKKSLELRAGQVVYARFLDRGFSRALHPFSVASCRFEPVLRLLIKSIPGGRDTSRLNTLTSNSTIRLAGPFHELCPDFELPQIWIAGGIGIAPFIGFLHCLPFQTCAPIRLLHFVGRAQDALCLDDWPELHDLKSIAEIKSIVDENGKKPNVCEVDELIEQCESAQFLICGSANFMKLMRRHLLKKGVSSNQIITEEFLP